MIRCVCNSDFSFHFSIDMNYFHKHRYCETEEHGGKQRSGQDRTGQDRTGQDRTGQDRTGQNNMEFNETR